MFTHLALPSAMGFLLHYLLGSQVHAVSILLTNEGSESQSTLPFCSVLYYKEQTAKH